MKSLSKWFLGLLTAGILLTGCEGFFGTKTDAEFIDIPVYDDKQVAYVPVLPILDQFSAPVDVITGYDELIYVADEGTNEIVSFDQAGNELGRYTVPGLKSIAQDRRLDLMAIGTFDTLGKTLTTIYRIGLDNGAGGHGINYAYIKNKIVHPFYYTTNPTGADLVEFTGISVRYDNRFFVTRTGPGSSPVFGPDDAVLLFGKDDAFQTPVVVQTSLGFFNDYFKSPSTIAGLAQPPQSTIVNQDGDFVFASLDPAQTLQVQYINVEESDGGTSYTVEQLTVGDTAKADGFLYSPNRFSSPLDVAITGDGTNYMFIVDGEKDSLYQFTLTGLEGVQPPAGSSSDKNILVSFGGTGNGPLQFNNPSGVAYLNEMLYVADKGNGRVLRFKLTTDFD